MQRGRGLVPPRVLDLHADRVRELGEEAQQLDDVFEEAVREDRPSPRPGFEELQPRQRWRVLLHPNPLIGRTFAELRPARVGHLEI